MAAAGGRHRLGLHVVSAALVDSLEAPTVLLAARRSRGPLAGGWELPGGKVEPGETPHLALRRELAEELGVAVALGPVVTGPQVGAWPLGDRGRLEVFLARAEREPQDLQDHDELRWLRLSDPGEDPPWLEADLAPVRALRERRRTTRLLVLHDRDTAEDVAAGLRSKGAEAGVHRELLAGEDDLEDAQWVVALEPGPASLAIDDAELEQVAEDLHGWVERHR